MECPKFHLFVLRFHKMTKCDVVIKYWNFLLWIFSTNKLWNIVYCSSHILHKVPKMDVFVQVSYYVRLHLKHINLFPNSVEHKRSPDFLYGSQFYLQHKYPLFYVHFNLSFLAKQLTCFNISYLILPCMKMSNIWEC